jgi:nucleotide-binding universal stress UspA family protein
VFERILLPLDGTETGEIVLPYGEEFARELGSQIILYQVRGPQQDDQERMRMAYLDRLSSTVQEDVKKSTAKNIKIITKVQAGEPAQNICDLVSNNKIDLIIMASVSSSGLKIGKLIGSVTDHVCHTVPIPVLLIRSQVNPMPKNEQKLFTKLLVPLDGSDLSKMALPVAEKLAEALSIPITLFEMATMHRYVAYGYGPTIDCVKMDADEKKELEEEMTALNEKIKQKGIDVTSIVTLGNDAAIEIEKVSETIGADLIIMTTHGRSGLDRWVMGSVAEKVLRYGKVPLLLVNARAG